MGEWDAPYKTMDQGFEIKQLGVFAEMVKKGEVRPHMQYATKGWRRLTVMQ